MAVDTYSALLGLLEMGTGNNNNLWGDLFNQNVTDILDRAIAGRNSRSVTGGTLDLSASPPPAAASQTVDAHLVFTGTLVSTQTVIVPNLKKWWFVTNNTAGGPALLMKTPSGSANCSIPVGTTKIVVCDGSDGLKRLDYDSIGELFEYVGTAAPAGSLECTGALANRLGSPELYAKIGTTWGAGDGVTSYGLPDLYTSGRFTRSRSGSLAIGTYQADSFASHTHSASASATPTGSATTDSQGSHTHTASVTDPGHTHSVSLTPGSHATSAGGDSSALAPTGTTTGSNTTGISVSNASNGAHTHSVSLSLSTSVSVTVNSTGAAETRPICAVVMKCIRY